MPLEQIIRKTSAQEEKSEDNNPHYQQATDVAFTKMMCIEPATDNNSTSEQNHSNGAIYTPDTPMTDIQLSNEATEMLNSLSPTRSQMYRITTIRPQIVKLANEIAQCNEGFRLVSPVDDNDPEDLEKMLLVINLYQKSLQNSIAINDHFRRDNPLPLENYNLIIKELDAHTRKLGQDMVLIRATKEVDKYTSLKVGDEFEDKGFVSTTTNFLYVAETSNFGHSLHRADVFLIIHAPADTKVIVPIDYEKKDDGMGEVILARGTKFRVEKIDAVVGEGDQRMIKENDQWRPVDMALAPLAETRIAKKQYLIMHVRVITQG